MTRKLNVAIIGAGVAELHLVAFARLSHLYDIRVLCALDDPRTQDLADRFNVPECSESFDEVVARDDIDVIDICTPPTTHWPMCNQAVDAGKHVICE
ncbi:MAG: Gfo/Idh/MocA family protein, partial [Alphaproteobacteria bacterium]